MPKIYPVTDPWIIAIVAYVLLAIGSFVPTFFAMVRGVKPHTGGDSFQDSLHFSNEAKSKLSQHFSRIAGTLGFWKKQAEIYRRLHYYILLWSIPATVLIPFLVQAIEPGNASKWMVTIVSAHTAILLSFHKAFKVDSNFKTWRAGESNFYDFYRRMLDRPDLFGKTEAEQLASYFDAVENLRAFIRNAEIDNTPSVEEAQRQLAKEKSDTSRRQG
jgi:hypothetical protein